MAKKKLPPVTQGPTPVTGVTFGFQLTVLFKDVFVGSIRSEGRTWVLEFTQQSQLWPRVSEHESPEEAKLAAAAACAGQKQKEMS